MPALTAIRTPALQSLADQLSYAPKPTLLRHLQRIEQLAPLIESDGLYPEDFIVFRVTNYRPDLPNPALIPAADLLADLSALAEHLSSAARLTPDDLPSDHLTIDALAARWKVSRKTIERYRRLGLVARRIDKGAGHHAIAFLQGPVEWFESIHADRLASAATFTRMDPPLTDQIIRDARRYKSRLNLTRTAVTARLAQRLNRSPESIRRVLVNHDEHCPSTGSTPIFNLPLPPDQSLQRTMLAQSLQGRRTGTIAALHHRPPISVNRAINRARASLAHESLQGTPPLDIPADHPILTDPITTTNLAVPTHTDLSALLTHLRDHHAPILHEQRTRAAAVALLRARSAHLATQLHPSTPSGRILDEIETNLRWTTLLRINLTATQLPLTLSTIEQSIAGPIDTLDPARATSILQNAITTTTHAIDTAIARLDPAHPVPTGTLAAPVGLAITRLAARLPDLATPPTQGKAARRLTQDHTIPDWTHALWCVQTSSISNLYWLRPQTLLHPLPATISDRDRQILTRRYALDNTKPHTLTDLAQYLNTPPLHAARMAQAALKRAQPNTTNHLSAP